MGYVPSLHVLQEKLNELNNEGYDVHTVTMVMYDSSFWQVTILATDDDLDDHTWLYRLDMTGWALEPTEVHYP